MACLLLQEVTSEKLAIGMDRPTSAIMKNLNGYILPQDSLSEIRSLLMKRYQNPFSETLSAEARLAMQQVVEEDTPRPEIKQEVTSSQLKQSETTRPEKSAKGRRKGRQDQQRSRISSFSDTFAKTSSDRLEGDITDENYDKDSQKKKAIGGKLESAMETIEIVKHGEPDEPAMDADVVKRNSVEKCLVWMEVNGETDKEKVGRFNTSI